MKHPHFGRSSRFPCTYQNCPCTFKSWNALIVHQSKIHSTGVTHKEKGIFSCHLCACSNLTSERDYFSHINAHLKRNETVTCMFLGCDFKTNIYCTFKSHKNRKHCHHTLADFKPKVVATVECPTALEDEECVDPEPDIAATSNWHCHTKDLQKFIEQTFAAALLKLEHFIHVPSKAVDEFLGELHHLICFATAPLSSDILSSIFDERDLPVN